MSEYQPRAAIWTGPIGDQDLTRVLAEASERLADQLLGTGLHLVGFAVIEETSVERGLRLSWKVFSGSYLNEEERRG